MNKQVLIQVNFGSIDFGRPSLIIKYLNLIIKMSLTATYYLLYSVKHRIFSSKRPQPLFNFKALWYGTYWMVALKKGRALFQSNRNCSWRNLKRFLFKQQLVPIIIVSCLMYSRTTGVFFYFVILCILAPHAF